MIGGHELTVAERAAVLRACREKRENLQHSLRTLTINAERGDTVARTAATVVGAELEILEAAIRTLWKQSGCDPPPGE